MIVRERKKKLEAIEGLKMTQYITCPECGFEIPVPASRLGRKPLGHSVIYL